MPFCLKDMCKDYSESNCTIISLTDVGKLVGFKINCLLTDILCYSFLLFTMFSIYIYVYSIFLCMKCKVLKWMKQFRLWNLGNNNVICFGNEIPIEILGQLVIIYGVNAMNEKLQNFNSNVHSKECTRQSSKI